MWVSVIIALLWEDVWGIITLVWEHVWVSGHNNPNVEHVWVSGHNNPNVGTCVGKWT